MRWLFLILSMISVNAYTQCKTYRLSTKGDTLNCTDVNDLRQGRWVLRYEHLRGEPGYEEEGVYVDGKKEGVWRKYSLMGDLLAVERYRFGHKNGVSQYFTLAGLEREESWKAVNPDHPYDTVEVPDPSDPYKVALKVVKLEGNAVKHGSWKYYNPERGTIVRIDEYVLDQLQKPGQKTAGAAKTGDTTAAVKTPPKVKPPEVQEYEKKSAGKKKIKVREGRTGM